MHWLFEAKKRFGLTVLNYIVTSNHIHLLVQDSEQQVISQSMQLIAGRTAQEYNARKKRKGAFWEDRYHATAVDSHEHLIKCLVYMDLNMVRAGVVQHPSGWVQSGYNEIQNTPERYTIINQKKLSELVGVEKVEDLKKHHKRWIEEGLVDNELTRDDKWTDSLAVGGQQFVEQYLDEVGIKAK